MVVGDLRTALSDIAAAKLSPMEEDILLGMMKARSDVTKKALEQQLRDIKRSLAGPGSTEDVERIALRVVDEENFENGDHIRRVAKQFWVFYEGSWRHIEDENVRNTVQQTLFKLRENAPTNRDKAILRAALDELKTSTAASQLWQMYCAQVVGRNGMDQDPLKLLEPARPVINCPNGELHFKKNGSFGLTRHHPELFLTTQIPIEYSELADTTEWDSFCDIIFHDSLDPLDMKRHLEEVLGYILQPWRDIPSIFILKGEPLAGKTTILSILERLLGTTVVTQKFGAYDGKNAHAMAGLVGKLLLVDPDFADGDQMPDGFLKTISEGGVVTANPKNKDEYNFRMRCVPMVLSNHWPSSRDFSGAMERRILAWNFSTIPEELRDDLARARLLSSRGLSGVLKRAVDGFSRLYARHWRGEGRQGWVIPDECKDAAEHWREHRDVVLRFYKHCVIKSERVEEGYSKSDAYEYFNQWRQCEGISGRWSLKGFTNRFDALCPFHPRNGVRRYWGIDISVNVDD